MPLETQIALISTITEKPLKFQDLGDENLVWKSAPPEFLEPFKYQRCHCTGPASGYQVGLKYDGLICRIDVTAWGISYRKSTPSYQDMEVIQITQASPYRLEIVFL
ncbi:MAG: hypothetical protein V7701_15120 [Sneathiella sp.]